MGKLFLSEERLHQLLAMAGEDPRDSAFFHLGLSSGFRASDLTRIRIADVIDDDKEIVRVLRIKMKKTKTWIERPLRDDCRRAIARLLEARTDGNPFLFVGKRNTRFFTQSNQPISRRTAHNIYRRYLEQMYPWSVLQGTGCHVTRRSVAKLISQKTGRIEPATQFLGHKSIATTMTYIDMDSWGEKANEIVTDLKW